MKTPILLIVDDEKPTRDALRMALQDDYEVYCAANLTQAKSILAEEPVDLVLTDLRLGGENGMDLLTYTKEIDPSPACIVMTAYGSVNTAVEAMRLGAFHFVTKPLNLDEVEMLLQRALHTKRLETTNKELKEKLDSQSGLSNILGKSKEIERIFTTIKQVAPTKTTILIEGESGTGKELVAHAIHTLSGRPENKFVAVNCAALSPQLLESELFGHEKGSFTGANQRRIGRFEQADGGTLFLDEIGEIDPSTQVKLLRALAEKTIERVGSNTPIKVDVRIITATNKSLQKLVYEDKFREDLYFRLNVVEIQMPPLRHRKEDIIILAAAFLKEFAHENGKTINRLADDAMQAIADYHWPGNVRELRTAIEHGVVMSNGQEVKLEHLPHKIRSKDKPTHPLLELKSINTTHSEEIKLVLENDLNLSSLEQRAIQLALHKTQGNKTEAAKLLGISRRTLQRKLLHPDALS